MPTGIRDKVVILGMGCSKFGEHWDKNAEDLVLDSYEECLADAGDHRIEHRVAALWYDINVWWAGRREHADPEVLRGVNEQIPHAGPEIDEGGVGRVVAGQQSLVREPETVVAPHDGLQ